MSETKNICDLIEKIIDYQIYNPLSNLFEKEWQYIIYLIEKELNSKKGNE